MHAPHITSFLDAIQKARAMLKLSAFGLVAFSHSLVQADDSPSRSCQNMVKPNLQSKVTGKLPSGLSQIKARFHVDDANQIDLIELDGPAAFYPIVREAIEQYRCSPVGSGRWMQQVFNIQIDIEPPKVNPNLFCSHMAPVQLGPGPAGVRAGSYLVKAVFSWDKDKVLQIRSIHGPQVFKGAVLEALTRYECLPDQVIEQEFEFRIHD